MAARDRKDGEAAFFTADGLPDSVAIEGAVMGRLFDAFPAFVSTEGIVREVAGETTSAALRDAIGEATRQLGDTGLLHFFGHLLTPTRAALRARALLGDP